MGYSVLFQNQTCPSYNAPSFYFGSAFDSLGLTQHNPAQEPCLTRQGTERRAAMTLSSTEPSAEPVGDGDWP